jgi:signal-transduction protein with cAMP-binding, CBS, and nucleotidyltransferase domain
MKTSVIRQRVADFLRQNAPFDSLDPQDLLELAGSGKVKFHQSEEYVYWQGDSRSELIWVIQQGRVELIDERGGVEKLHDVVGAGDVLGLDGFVGDGKCQYAARTASDVLLYGVNARLFDTLAAKYPEVDRFVKARYSMAGWVATGRRSWLDAEGPPAAFLKARLGRYQGDLNDAARVPVPFQVRDAVVAMLRRGSDAVAVETQDGEIEGVLTSRELALFCGQDAPGLVHELRGAQTAEEVAPLLKLAAGMVEGALGGAGDVDECCLIVGSVTRAAVEASIRIAVREADAAGIVAPQVPYCWVAFGAAARGDMPQPVFPTIAAIYDDSQGEIGGLDSFYFVSVAGMTGHWLQECGLSGVGMHWPDGVQPGMPLSEWKRLYSETVRDPLEFGIYERREFFDVAPLVGDVSIELALEQHMAAELEEGSMAMGLLSNDTMENVPPLTFFEGLVVDLDGGRRESFDIEAALVGPVADAARVFALSRQRLAHTSTLERLELAIVDYPQGEAVLREAADAFRIGMYHQTLAAGRMVHPRKLSKSDQSLLKTAIASVGRLLAFTVATFLEER